jgi:hypothetical protein
MFVAKPHKKGDAQELDANDKSKGLTNLAEEPGAENLNAIDNRPLNNPDAAGAPVASQPDFRGGHPQGNMRSGNQSGGGTLHPTARTSAPMSNPFPGPRSTVPTSPSTIKE